MATIYMAGGLFNAGERLGNLYLEKYLKLLGHKIILPQREAIRFFKDGKFDINSMVADCQKNSANEEVIYVGNADGADPDSGTAVEYGIAITVKGKAIVYRTDFRTALENEVGLNSMLRLKGTTFIYEPCFVTELDQADDYYKRLACKIHDAICAIAE